MRLSEIKRDLVSLPSPKPASFIDDFGELSASEIYGAHVRTKLSSAENKKLTGRTMLMIRGDI